MKFLRTDAVTAVIEQVQVQCVKEPGPSTSVFLRKPDNIRMNVMPERMPVFQSVCFPTVLLDLLSGWPVATDKPQKKRIISVKPLICFWIVDHLFIHFRAHFGQAVQIDGKTLLFFLSSQRSQEYSRTDLITNYIARYEFSSLFSMQDTGFIQSLKFGRPGEYRQGTAFRLIAGMIEHFLIKRKIICRGAASKDQAEEIIASGKADMVVIGRAQLADAQFCEKAKEGRTEDIVRCIGCNQSCYEMTLYGKPITCMRNPSVGREREFEALKKTQNPKNILVIGGGVGGMEAAEYIRARGSDVTVIEMQDKAAKDVGPPAGTSPL